MSEQLDTPSVGTYDSPLLAQLCLGFSCMLPPVFGPHSYIPGQGGRPAAPSQYSRLLHIPVEDQPILSLGFWVGIRQHLNCRGQTSRSWSSPSEVAFLQYEFGISLSTALSRKFFLELLLQRSLSLKLRLSPALLDQRWVVVTHSKGVFK